jgi:PAT family beta-lactamase induction signal transducer AmpG
LRQMGTSLELIGLSSILFIPWALKFLWAPWVDGHYSAKWGQRRSWLLPMQGAMVVLLLLMAVWRPELSIWSLMVLVLLINLVSATQDIATDGLAVSVLTPAERGIGNGLQVGAYRVGMIAGGGLLLGLIDVLGWYTSFLLMVGMVMLSSVPVWRLREPAPVVPERVSAPPSATPLRDFMKLPHAWSVMVLLIGYKFGNAMADGMLKPFMVDAGLGLSDIGWISGVVGSVAGLVGALLGGALTKPLGHRRALVLFAVLQAFSWLGFVVWSAPSWWQLVALVSVEHVASGLGTVALFTSMMDWCRPHHGAVDYTLQASVVVICTGLATMVSGVLAKQVGYTIHFAISAALCLGSAWLAAKFYVASLGSTQQI